MTYSSPQPNHPSQRVFISYRIQEPDCSLAREFCESLQAAGHCPFMAEESIGIGDNWAERIDRELQEADYFLLFLSQQSAYSEMVIEEVRRARELRSQNPQRKPIILPIRVNLAFNAPLNYDLRSYLQRIQQRRWNSAADTSIILQEILALLAGNAEEIPVLEVTQIAPVTESSEIPPPPLPVAEPELPRGAVPLTSVWYVERSLIESNCYQEIVKPGALIQIKAPRQMGKTSLMARILAHAEQQSCRIVSISFQQTRIPENLGQFLRRFCALVSNELGRSRRQVQEDLEQYIDSDLFDAKDNCTAYFEECLLPNITSSLVLGLDEFDSLFRYSEVTQEFCSLLRFWNQKATDNELWQKLRLAIVCSTEAYIANSIYQSPLANVGLSIKLPDFSSDQVLNLARNHGLNWQTREVEQLTAIVGGHPYLVRLAIYTIAHDKLDFDTILRESTTEAGIYGDHLKQHLWNLERHPELMAAFRQVLMTDRPVRIESVLAFKLEGMGLVNQEGNEARVRHDLYRRYFQEYWGIH